MRNSERVRFRFLLATVLQGYCLCFFFRPSHINLSHLCGYLHLPNRVKYYNIPELLTLQVNLPLVLTKKIVVMLLLVMY
jgi:hypothetical protein